ncbi:LysR family transcriptional regulator [Seohaeicola saemankumensis]|nr:LysR family transcriptional regulator [Seohaeicola saemankumensis]MCA0871742.1 LysR family transcriptional regulator [Seohaeicola saemankumensis]
MDWLSMPPLAALRAFAAFAEAGNVVRAGEAMNVSHAAVSQQLRALEAHLGVALLDRSGRALVMTDAGERLARALELGFGAIGDAVQELTGAGAQRPLHVTTTPSFAAFWLLPRLSEFRLRHPEIDLVVDPTPALTRLEPGGIDLALRYGQGNWPGLQSEPLLISPIIVAAAPALIRGLRIESPADLSNLPWLEELGTTEAGNWLRSKGVEQGIAGGRLQLPGNLLAGALREGQGVGVMVRHFAEPDLRSGQLVELFCEADEGAGYHIVTRPGPLRPEAKTFVSWLRRHRSV